MHRRLCCFERRLGVSATLQANCREDEVVGVGVNNADGLGHRVEGEENEGGLSGLRGSTCAPCWQEYAAYIRGLGKDGDRLHVRGIAGDDALAVHGVGDVQLALHDGEADLWKEGRMWRKGVA